MVNKQKNDPKTLKVLDDAVATISMGKDKASGFIAMGAGASGATTAAAAGSASKHKGKPGSSGVENGGPTSMRREKDKWEERAREAMCEFCCTVECQQLQEQVLQLKHQNEELWSDEFYDSWFLSAQNGLSECQRVIDAVYKSRCTWQDVGDAVLEVLNNDLIWDAVKASARQEKDRVSRGLEALLVQLDALDPLDGDFDAQRRGEQCWNRRQRLIKRTPDPTTSLPGGINGVSRSKKITSKRNAQYEHLIVELKSSLDEKNSAILELRKAHKESQSRLLAAQRASQKEQEAHHQEVVTLKMSLTLALKHQNTAIEEKQAAVKFLLKKLDKQQSRGRSLASITTSVEEEDSEGVDAEEEEDREVDSLGLDFVANLTDEEFEKLDEVKRSEVVARRYSQAIERVQKEYEGQKSLLQQAEEEIDQNDERRKRTNSIALGNIVVQNASKVVASDLQNARLQLQAANEQCTSTWDVGDGKCTLCEKHQVRLMEISSQLLLKETQNALSETSDRSNADPDANAESTSKDGESMAATYQLTQTECPYYRKVSSTMFAAVQEGYLERTLMQRERIGELAVSGVSMGGGDSYFSPSHRKKTIVRKILTEDEVLRRRLARGERIRSAASAESVIYPTNESQQAKDAVTNRELQSGDIVAEPADPWGDDLNNKDDDDTPLYLSYVDPDGHQVYYEDVEVEDGGRYEEQEVLREDLGGSSNNNSSRHLETKDPSAERLDEFQIVMPHVVVGNASVDAKPNDLPLLHDWDDIERDPEVITQLRDIVKQNAATKEALAVTNWKILLWHLRAWRDQHRLDYFRESYLDAAIRARDLMRKDARRLQTHRVDDSDEPEVQAHKDDKIEPEQHCSSPRKSPLSYYNNRTLYPAALVDLSKIPTTQQIPTPHFPVLANQGGIDNPMRTRITYRLALPELRSNSAVIMTQSPLMPLCSMTAPSIFEEDNRFPQRAVKFVGPGYDFSLTHSLSIIAQPVLAMQASPISSGRRKSPTSRQGSHSAQPRKALDATSGPESYMRSKRAAPPCKKANKEANMVQQHVVVIAVRTLQLQRLDGAVRYKDQEKVDGGVPPLRSRAFWRHAAAMLVVLSQRQERKPEQVRTVPVADGDRHDGGRTNERTDERQWRRQRFARYSIDDTDVRVTEGPQVELGAESHAQQQKYPRVVKITRFRAALCMCVQQMRKI
ncbi:hypothetical protein FI667_g7902, partial [Globisporangium splendens]